MTFLSCKFNKREIYGQIQTGSKNDLSFGTTVDILSEILSHGGPLKVEGLCLSAYIRKVLMYDNLLRSTKLKVSAGFKPV